MKPTPEGTEEFKVEDRRHWTRGDDSPETEAGAIRPPSAVEEYERRAEAAESRLQEYIAAFKEREREQDALRERLAADVQRRVDLQFGELLQGLLETMDHLDLALSHAARVPEAEPLAAGVAIARDRFLTALERQGVQPIDPASGPFDPNFAEAVRIDPVDSPELDGSVTETLRPGYALGHRVVRPAQVAVGRYAPKDDQASPKAR